MAAVLTAERRGCPVKENEWEQEENREETNMNDKLEKKEWWELLKGASFFAVVLTLIVNEYSYKSMDSTIYVIACVAELLIFLTAIGVDYVRYVVMNEPIKKMEPEKMERRRKRLKWETAIYVVLALAVFFWRVITGNYLLFQ